MKRPFIPRRRLRRAVVGLIGIVGLAGSVHAAEAVYWRAPAMTEIAWRGMLGTEGGAVGMGTQIGPYPAFGLAGLLVAIATHAAISQGVQNSERQKAQDEADKVLAPYAPALKAWSPTALWSSALAANSTRPAVVTLQAWDGPPAAAPPGPVVETAPVYTLSQDEGVLLLDVAVKLVAAPGAAPVDTVVRVISSPHDAADARAHWSADEARRLKDTAAAMLAHALQIALRPPAADAAAEMRTHRYLQGAVERTERAQQVGGDCSRAVLRNLRGWLLSVPLKPSAETPCPHPSTF